MARLAAHETAATPARMPKTNPSSSELLASRLAPCTPLHATSPAAKRPGNVVAPDAPGDLFTAVHFNVDHWQIDGPDEARLGAAREELGLPDGAPVPLEVTVELPGPLYAQKIVWLGDARANPASPAFSYGPDLARGEHALEVAAPPGGSVR